MTANEYVYYIWEVLYLVIVNWKIYIGVIPKQINKSNCPWQSFFGDNFKWDLELI